MAADKLAQTEWLMKKIIGIIFLFVSFASQATVETGNSFLAHVETSKTSISARSYLNGYVAGMYDAHETKLAQCLGGNVRMTQIVDSLKIYLEKNPQTRHHEMNSLFLPAIRSQFNCNK